MIEPILNGLKGIADFFSALWGFIETLFEDLIMMIKLITGAIVTIPVYMYSIFPVAVMAIIAGLITIVLLYKVLGRD